MLDVKNFLSDVETFQIIFKVNKKYPRQQCKTNSLNGALKDKVLGVYDMNTLFMRQSIKILKNKLKSRHIHL